MKTFAIKNMHKNTNKEVYGTRADSSTYQVTLTLQSCGCYRFYKVQQYYGLKTYS